MNTLLRRWALSLALILPGAHAAVSIVVTPGPWNLYQGTAVVAPPGGSAGYLTQADCVEAARRRGLAATYTCRTMTVVALAIVPDPPPPVVPVLITTQPVSLSVVEGAALSVVVAATGDAPIGYVWFKDGAVVQMAGGLLAGPAFSIAAAQLSDAGSYLVVVSNAAGKVTSAAAVLTVTPRGKATVSWSAPVTQADGTPSSALAGYIVHYGRASRAYTAQQAVPGAATTTATISGLAAGTWYFGVTAVDSAGNESALDYEVSKTIP